MASGSDGSEGSGTPPVQGPPPEGGSEATPVAGVEVAATPPGEVAAEQAFLTGPTRAPDAAGSMALVPLVPAAPPPTMQLATTLESAQPRAFVHVDDDGQVRSPARYRALQAVGYAVAGSVVAGVTGVYGALLGPPGVLIGLGLGAYLAWHVRRGRRLQEAVTLLAHDRLDEAEQALNEVRFSFRCPRPLKAIAEQNLGSIASRRGDYETALEHQRNALVLYARMRRKNPMRQLAEYSEEVTLVNLGRTGEARQRFDARAG
jgi:hypothetical protein